MFAKDRGGEGCSEMIPRQRCGIRRPGPTFQVKPGLAGSGACNASVSVERALNEFLQAGGADTSHGRKQQGSQRSWHPAWSDAFARVFQGGVVLTKLKVLDSRRIYGKPVWLCVKLLEIPAHCCPLGYLPMSSYTKLENPVVSLF